MGERWDVVVAGAGPAGATVANLLARAGARVLVLEKEFFPRFRIGESLLPVCLPVLARLDASPVPDVYVYKRGAQFVDEDGGRQHAFAFDEALPGVPRHAWHVERSLFDLQLAGLAAEAGAEVQHGQAVTGVEADRKGVRVRTASGEESARFFVDATGQGRLLARRQRTVRHHERFGMSSVYTHFEDVGDVYSEVFGEANDIRILVREEGWGWVIPLPNRRLSVGIVSRDRLEPGVLDRGLLQGPLMRRLTAGARRLQTRIVGSFGYRNTAPFGARTASIGDAAAFLDPVFSSGVALAFVDAAGLADALAGALAAGTESTPASFAEHGRTMERGYCTFEALIERFYHSTFTGSFFLRDAPHYDLRRGVMSVLAGDVWRHDNPFQEMLLRGRRASVGAEE